MPLRVYCVVLDWAMSSPTSRHTTMALLKKLIFSGYLIYYYCWPMLRNIRRNCPFSSLPLLSPIINTLSFPFIINLCHPLHTESHPHSIFKFKSHAAPFFLSPSSPHPLPRRHLFLLFSSFPCPFNSFLQSPFIFFGSSAPGSSPLYFGAFLFSSSPCGFCSDFELGRKECFGAGFGF